VSGGQGFTLEPDSARRGAAKFGTAADQLGDAAMALANALSAAGVCWGGDESGNEFAKDYVPGSEGAVKAFASIAEGLRGMQKNVEATADSVENTEGSIRHGFEDRGR
jgi:hypothetical protein